MNKVKFQREMQKLINFIKENFYLLQKPEFFFQPNQLINYNFRKIKAKFNIKPKKYEQVTLPWGHGFRICPQENLGKHIWKEGLYDLCLSETIWRLLDPGELAVDVGANIGQMTSVMSAKVGLSGQVMAFEPNPDVYADFIDNINLWSNLKIGKIVPQKLALGEYSGEAILGAHEEFEENRGRSSLVVEGSKDNQFYEYKRYNIEIKRLDEILDNKSEIGVLKIDVEGFESDVLKGSSKLLENHKIRDILFEQWSNYPTPLTDLLESYGYSLFYFKPNFLGLEVDDIQEENLALQKRYRNYLATNDPERALKRLRKKGWYVFQLGHLPWSSYS